MSDRLPGTSYDNPIRYRGYRIFLGDSGPWSTNWHYVHEDFDGPEDGRCGVCRTEAECRAEVDERVDDSLVEVRITGSDVAAAAADSWPVIGAAWALGLATIFATWNGSLFG